MKTYLLLFLLIFCGLPQKTTAQLIPGDVNKPINQVYALAAANYGSDPAPTFTVTPPTTCTGTGSVTITWAPTVVTAAKNRRFSMHNVMNYSGNLVYTCVSPTWICPPAALNLNSTNSFSQTFTGLLPGVYTFGLNRDPGDDDLTTNNPASGALDDFSTGGWNDPTSDNSRCAVVGLTLLPVNSNNLTTCTIAAVNATNCTTADGSITISGLAPSTAYNTSHLVNGSWTGSVNSTPAGTLTISGLLTGIYPVQIRRNGEICFRQFNIKVGNNSGIECFADNQLIDPSLGTTMVTGGNFGVSSGALPTNGTTDYTLVPWSSGEPGDSRYSLDDTTDHTPNGVVVGTGYDYRLRNFRYTTDTRHLYACIQLTGDHTGSFNQNNGNTGTGQGFMMIVNANYRTDRVLNISNMNLVAGRSYVLSFWGKNLQPFMPRNKNNGTLSQTYQPIIPRLALAVNGIIYDFADMSATLEPTTYTTTTVLNQMGWTEYNLRFIAPVNNSNSNITIYNFQQGGFGNDFAIDDVQLLALSVIGDRVWNDLDRDGVQDINEPGLANVVATLLDNSNNPLQTTVSDAFGYYQFANVAPGVSPGTDYKVRFTLPASYVFSPMNASGNANTDSDVNPSGANFGMTNSFNLTTGNSIINIDCGLVYDQPLLPASIGNIVWLDVNNDGIQNAGESGLANVTVVLYNNVGAIISTTVTDASGLYRFDNLAAGNYRVGITQPTGTICTLKNQGGNNNLDSDINTSGANIRRTDLFTLLANQQMDTVDIGISIMPSASSSFGDFCWQDLNSNGLQNVGEPGLMGVKVVLINPGVDNIRFTADDVRIDSTFTDIFGIWQFTNLTGTRYFVTFAPPSGYSYTTLNVGTDESIDSDVNSTGVSDIIYINNTPYGFNYPLLDVGFTITPPMPTAGRVGNYFWNDINGNGIQEASEFGVPGITVNLLNTSGVVVQTTTTDLNGNYVFPYVPPANYSVRFSNIPPGYQFTTRDQGTSNTDSDVDLNTGETSIFTVAASQVMDSIDAGIRQVLHTGNSSIGSYVWFDFNNNGIQDLTETGVGGITVTLRNLGPNGVVNESPVVDDILYTTTTNALGQFMFNGLPQGVYRVEIIYRSTLYSLSTIDLGGNDNRDSDGILGASAAGFTQSFTNNFRVLFGEDKLNIAFGLVPNSTVNVIGNRVWKDNNSNGIQDAGENEGVQGVVVQLLNSTGTALEDSDASTAGIQPFQTTTNELGYWNIVGAPNGTYIPRFALLPPGFRITSHKIGVNTTDSDILGNGRSSVTVTVNGATRINNDIDLGLIPQSTVIGDFVWDDLNGDGLQTVGEPGIGSVTATIFNTANVALGSAVTDASGRYYFPNTPLGTYYLRYNNYPSGMQFTSQEATPFLTNGSNVNPTTQQTLNYNITTFGDTFHIDAGLRVLNTANVGNYVWMDTNGNGIQDATERPLSGVVVRLRNAGPNGIVNDGDDFTLGSTITDGAGFYQFIITPTGNNYYLSFSNNPPGSSFTTQNVGGAGASNNSKVNPASGLTTTFNLAYGATNQIQDAGLINISILPIDYELFTAEKVNSTVQLKWKVGNPTEVMRYDVMHSSNGFSFNKIATVNSNINLQSPSFIHNNPIVGNNYYRIVAVDLWGQAFQSDVKVVKFVKNESFNVYPNPVNNILFVNSLNTISTNFEYRIIDINGKQLKAGIFQNNIESIDVQQLPSGNYVLILMQGGQQKFKHSFLKK